MPNGFARKGRKKLKKELRKYIEKHLPYIHFTNNKRDELNNYREDAAQHIVQELIKLYPKKYKYTDFDWVTRSAIRRKSIDITNKFGKKDKREVSENTRFKIRDKNTDNYDDSLELQDDLYCHRVNESMKDWEEKTVRKRKIEYIEDLVYKITYGFLKEEFNDWDREYLDSLIFLYNLGYSNFSKDDIYECMGYDVQDRLTLNSKLVLFRNRLKKCWPDRIVI